MTNSTALAKTQKPLTSMTPAERMAHALKPRKLTGFDVCLQATPSKVYRATGAMRTA